GGVDVRRRSPTARARDAQMTILRVPAVEVVRGGRTRPLFPTSARVSNLPANWDGMALEVSRIVPWVVPDHEHPTHLLNLIVEGPAHTTTIVAGRTFSEPRSPGTVTLVPRGTIDRTVYHDAFTVVCLALHPQLLARAVSETEREVELLFKWSFSDRQIA